MKLVYLEIKNFKNINNIKLNFDRSLTVDLKLDIDKEDESLEAYYCKLGDNIQYKEDEGINIFDCNINFNAIVGENGTGKTNILEAICKFTEMDNEHLIFKVYYYQSKYFYWISDKSKKFYNSDDTIGDVALLSHTKFSDTIFYSEISSPHIFCDAKITNIAFWKKIQENQMNYVSNYINNNFNKNSILYMDKDYDFSQSINPNKNTEIEQISLNYSINKIKNEMQVYQLLLEKELKFKPDIENNISNVVFEFTHDKFVDIEVDEPEDIFILLVEIVFNAYLDKKISYSDDLAEQENLKEFSEWIKQNLHPDTEDNKVTYMTLKKVINTPAFRDDIDVDLLLTKLQDIQTFKKEYIKLLERLEKDVDYNEEFLNVDKTIKFKNKHCTKLFIKSLLPFTKYDLFNLKWDVELSTGEESLMYFYSRLYEIFMKKNDTKDFIIVLDEIEAYLHPNWQKNFISSLNNFLKLKSFEDYSFNVIMTTHSPFLLSDLENKNITYLSKNKENLCIDESDEINIDPFGSNIHELLTHSFFMKGELPIGAFAKTKIEEVIKYLNSKNKLSLEEDLFCIKIISIIGEPVLQKRLWMMYDNKIKASKNRPKDELIRIQKYLEEQLKNE